MLNLDVTTRTNCTNKVKAGRMAVHINVPVPMETHISTSVLDCKYSVREHLRIREIFIVDQNKNYFFNNYQKFSIKSYVVATSGVTFVRRCIRDVCKWSQFEDLHVSQKRTCASAKVCHLASRL